MMTWFDNVKTHVGWDKADRTQIAELRRWLDSDATGVIEGLGKQLAQFIRYAVADGQCAFRPALARRAQ